MFLALLAACGGGFDGTWEFTVTVTAPTGTECATTVTHNFIGAYEPIAAVDDGAWQTTTTSEVSPSLVYGRIETTATGSTLILGSSALPGTETDGRVTFTWEGSATNGDTYQHATGYKYTASTDTVETTAIALSETKGVLNGAWDESSQSVSRWTESDTWSDEAAAYVGTGGLTPVANYLLKLDTSGVEAPATNTQSSYDCGEGSCTLSVQQGCAYRYEVSGVRTDFLPEDANWTEDAGQNAGI